MSFSKKVYLTSIYLALLIICNPAAADAADPRVFESGERQILMLEMFSSQGCSSCPPAERWISGLREDPRLWHELVPLVFHVDYWDDLGWKDPYSKLKYSQRQRRYKLHGHSRAVYTPGFMASGQEWRGWFQRRSLPPQSQENAGNLNVVLQGDAITARFVRNADSRGLRFNAAVLGFDVVTPVEAGENRGRKLKQNFLVLAHGEWSNDVGLWQVTLPETDFEGRRAVAFWVSSGMDPSPIQATGGWID